MRKSRRALALVMAGLMGLSMTACGSGQTETTAAEETTTESAAEAADETTEAEAEEESSEEAAASDTSRFLFLPQGADVRHRRV